MFDPQTTPLWAIFAAGLVLVTGAVEGGRLVRRRARVEGDDNLSTLEGSVLGLLALMVGFSFSIAVEHFDTRRAGVLEEANAIGTAALRARLLPAPHDRESLALLRDYAKSRLDAAGKARTNAELDPHIARASELHEALWRQAKAAMAKDAGMVPTGLYIQSLNDVIDSHQKRVTAARVRLPAMVMIALYLVAFVAAGLVGYGGGLASRRANLPAYVASALMVSVVMLVHDLDRPSTGFIKVDQQPMIDTVNGLAGYKD